MKYEVGVVYENTRGKLWLAVSHNTLLSAKEGKVTTVKPRIKYIYRREFPVDALCEQWGITLDKLDEIMSSYIVPTTTRTRPRGKSRKKSSDTIAEGFEIRFARMLLG